MSSGLWVISPQNITIHNSHFVVRALGFITSEYRRAHRLDFDFYNIVQDEQRF